MLKQLLEEFIAPVYGKTSRSNESYRTVAEYCTRNLARLVTEYAAVQNNQQLLQEIRKDIDQYLRRYHKYCIEERAGMLAHYYEIGADDNCDFEHLIPASRLRDLLLARKLTVEQALNAPTVRLSRSKHLSLKDAGWESKTPNMWLPFERYTNVFDARYQTYDGTDINPFTWTLEQHFKYFDHLIVR